MPPEEMQNVWRRQYKSVCVREANGRWCIVTDYGGQDVGELQGLAEAQVHRVAAKFGMTCTTRSSQAALKSDVSH